jgi:hypothetical protein
VHSEESQNAQWAQLIGLKEMYERSPNQKWYYIVGCDNFINGKFVLLSTSMTLYVLHQLFSG